MHMKLSGKFIIHRHQDLKKKIKNTEYLRVFVSVSITAWKVLAYEYSKILVGCQRVTAYWMSAITWSRFVNESHEYIMIHSLTTGDQTKNAHSYRENFIWSTDSIAGSRNYADGLPYGNMNDV